jgi:hypothetical protein
MCDKVAEHKQEMLSVSNGIINSICFEFLFRRKNKNVPKMSIQGLD